MAAVAATAAGPHHEAVKQVRTRRVGRWYFGGVAGSMAAGVTHPLDLIKVHLQTVNTKAEKVSMARMVVHVVKNDGILGLYSGLSAAILRQFSYTLVRFGIYETGKVALSDDKGSPLPGYQKVGLACYAGFVGGFFGTPADLVNVRMQNDVKLPPELRRKYKHALNGLFRVATEEGFKRLFSGATMACMRGALMTCGQLASYDTVKEFLIAYGIFNDNIYCHLAGSSIAASVSTFLTQPVDVMKTKMMNAKPGEYSSVGDCIMKTGKLGPSAFYKGFVPSFIRLTPHTICVFIFFEQIKKYFGRDEIIED